MVDETEKTKAAEENETVGGYSKLDTVADNVLPYVEDTPLDETDYWGLMGPY